MRSRNGWLHDSDSEDNPCNQCNNPGYIYCYSQRSSGRLTSTRTFHIVRTLMLCTDIGFFPFTMQTLGVLTLGRKDNTSKQYTFIRYYHILYSCKFGVSTLNQDKIMIQMQVWVLSWVNGWNLHSMLFTTFYFHTNFNYISVVLYFWLLIMSLSPVFTNSFLLALIKFQNRFSLFPDKAHKQ